ncbi:MAG: diacylglycerol kinase family lipid kinase [Oscillospiraceae bacterium]|nr:diacylglycerol kinase family lipid kinase [Oscillospiraceae bacterium]
MRHLFILNPIAGGGRRTEEARQTIQTVMSAQPEPWELYETTGPKDAIRKVTEAAKQGQSVRVYACGGDGTLNECVNGAVGYTNVAVTHFPTGTGNDFIKTFDTGRELFFDLNRLLDAEVMALDVIDAGGRYGINICSVGIDARIGADVHQYSNWPLVGGKGAYVVSLLANVIKRVAEPYEIEVEDKVYRQKITLICLCNGRSYGGAFTPVPDAMPDDGLLDILMAKQVSRLGVAYVVGKYAKGKFRDVPRVITHLQGKQATIRADHEFVVNVDGEILRRREVSFRLLPQAVNFFAPRGADFRKSEA